jgi:hypothetical protein
MEGRPRPVMSPYKQANERANLHSLQGKKRKAIKTALLKPQPRGVFLPRETPGALAILQDSLVGDAVHTAGGLHPRDPSTSKVLKLPALKMEDVDRILFEPTPPQDKIFELLRETWMLAGLDMDLNEYASPAVVEDAPIPTVNAIHVMRHPRSANTKCINFVGDGSTGRHRTFRFESNNNYLYIEKNKAKGAVYLRLDFNSTGKKTRSIRECVLIFNGSSSLRVEQRKEDQPVVKPEKASWETQATVAGLPVDPLEECIAKQSEHTSHLIAYLDEKFPASHPIPADGRGDDDAFSPDAYTPYHRAVLHNICKLHCTFAYLRALAAVLLRDTSGYTAPTTFESIVNQVQKKIDEGVSASRDESSSPLGQLTRAVACAADFVSSLAKSKERALNEEARAKLNAHIKKLYVKAPGLRAEDATYENLGYILAVRLFEHINPSEMLRDTDMSWIEDADKNELSGHEWEVGFNLKLHTNDTQDLKLILGDDVASVLTKYTFFNETRDPWRASNQHAMLVRYTATVPYVFTVHQPYATLYGTTVH